MFFLNKIDSSLKGKDRVVLVGNAPILTNRYNRNRLSHFIDDSEVVIRINSASNYAQGTGHKSDILGMINSGDPAIEFSYRTVINEQVKAEISSIWFSRPLNLYSNGKRKVLVKEDLSEYILDFQNLNHIPCHAISKELYKTICKEISPGEEGNSPEPSSGFCLLHMMLFSEKFKDLKKVLVGFTWEGWRGHNWELEKKICLDLHKKGEIYIF